MPEGPEIKTVAKTLENEIVGLRLGSLWHSNKPLRQKVDVVSLKRLKDTEIKHVSC